MISSSDISHESLIRQWKRLRTWVQEEASLTSDVCAGRGRGAAATRR